MARNVLVLAICQAAMMTGSSLLVATSALVGKALSGVAWLATLPLALQFLAMTLTTVPASFAMQRWGRRAGFLGGVALGLVGAGLATLAVLTGQFSIFCLGALLLGAFNGTGQFYRFAAADGVSETHRGRTISLVLAGGIVAAFLGPNIAAWTRELFDVTFAGSYLTLVLLYAVPAVALTGLRIPPPARRGDGRSGRPLAVIARQPRFLVAVASATVGYGAMNLLMVATPLAMDAERMAFSDVAFVIQWHVVAMFLPSFVTGELIRRFGVERVILAGALLLGLAVACNTLGAGVWAYWGGLVALGLAWNLMFIGGTTMLTGTHSEAERAKCQAVNDFVVFGTVTVTALTSGLLVAALGWRLLNLAALPLAATVLMALAWLRLTATEPEPAGDALLNRDRSLWHNGNEQ